MMLPFADSLLIVKTFPAKMKLWGPDQFRDTPSLDIVLKQSVIYCIAKLNFILCLFKDKNIQVRALTDNRGEQLSTFTISIKSTC